MSSTPNKHMSRFHSGRPQVCHTSRFHSCHPQVCHMSRFHSQHPQVCHTNQFHSGSPQVCHRGTSQKPFPLLHSGMSLAVPGIVSITLTPTPSPKLPVLSVQDLMDWTCIDTQEQEELPTSKGTLKRPRKKTTDFYIYISSIYCAISTHLSSAALPPVWVSMGNMDSLLVFFLYVQCV